MTGETGDKKQLSSYEIKRVSRIAPGRRGEGPPASN